LNFARPKSPIWCVTACCRCCGIRLVVAELCVCQFAIIICEILWLCLCLWFSGSRSLFLESGLLLLFSSPSLVVQKLEVSLTSNMASCEDGATNFI
ncbi:hypothetical protein S245_026355, partial [Arachis hypogaea]